jgi:hypothetical protein
VCGSVAVAGYLGAIIIGKYHRYRLLIAVIPSSLVGIIKELGDFLEVGT